jgi:hypothetical protein
VSPHDRRPLALLALAIILASGASHASSAAAKTNGGGVAAPAKHPKKPAKAQPEPQPPPQLTNPEHISAGNLAKDLGASGQVDPVAGLGIRNPVCDRLDQIRSRSTRLSCEANGSPESDYPTSNYGFDVFITTGVTHPIGDFTAALVTILNGIWLGLIFVLKLVLSLLGLAFGLNPFGDGQTMAQITAAVGRIYRRVTDPWLSALIVCGGIWFAYRGLLRRDLAGGVGGTLAAIAMLVLGLWVVHQPRESVGRLAELSNEVALGAISAPQSGSLHRPMGTYAEAMSRSWTRLVEVPFAGLDFSDVNWALSRPPPEAVKRADAYFCDDIGALTTLAIGAHFGSASSQEACARFARKRYGRPRRVIDLYLRSSPGSHSREALWDYFDKDEDERYKAKVAAQGGDGALTRLSMLALFAIGLLGAILLLAWLAIRLFTQAGIAFVLLLAAPFALFFPLLGESGRRAFKTWGLTLLGSILAKVIYAAFLSIVLLGISILGRVDGDGGSATGFLLSCAFSWAVFLKRGDLISLLSVGEHEHRSHLGLGPIAALGAARGVSRGAGESVRGFARRGADWRRERAELGGEATREAAQGSLQEGARALADQRYREASETVAAFEESRPQPAGTKGQRRPDPSASKSAAQGPPSAHPDRRRPAAPDSVPSEESYRDAKRLLAGAERNQRRTGQRWSARDLERFGNEDRELLERSREPGDHAHRAGYGRAQFESLRGPERERAEAEIEKARKRDLQRLTVASAPPGRVAGRGRLAAERIRQELEGSGSDRRQELRGLRLERRLDQAPSRRNLSRGG